MIVKIAKVKGCNEMTLFENRFKGASCCWWMSRKMEKVRPISGMYEDVLRLAMEGMRCPECGSIVVFER